MHIVAICHHRLFDRYPKQYIYLFFIQRYDNEDLPYVKVRHDHLYTYAFTILYVYCDMQRMTQ